MGSKRVISADFIRGVTVTPNFLSTSDAELGGSPIGTIVAYADAAAESPVDGTGGSPASTIAVSTDSSLVGTSNFLWTKSAANRQGEGFSQAFTIDSAYQSKPMTISAFYKVASGTFADNDMTVWVYDVTNAVLIQPSAYQIKNTTGVEQIKCEFQASSNSTSYRLIFHTASTSALAYTLRFDAFSISPNTYNSGAIVTDPVAYTPTFTGFGTVSTSNVRSWRSGSHLIIQGTFTSGTPTGVEARVSIGYNGTNGSIVSASTLPTVQSCGNWFVNINGAATDPVLVEANVGYITFGHGYSSGSPLSKAIGTLIVGTGTIMSFYASVPIAGWGTSQVLSSETSTNVVSAIVNGNPSASYTSGNPIIFPTVVKDSTGSYNTTTGEYTCSVEGWYDVTAFVSSNIAQGNTLSVYVDGVQKLPLLGLFYVTGIGNGSTQVYCTAGQKITLRASANWSAISSGNGMTITRRSGPAQIAASETVTAAYYVSAATQTPGATTQINFDTKIYDSHGAVTTGAGAWKFTAPISGLYRVGGIAGISGVTTSYMFLYKGGSQVQYCSGNMSATTGIVNIGAEIKLLAGEFIDIRPSGGATLSGATPYQTKVEITRVGNY